MRRSKLSKGSQDRSVDSQQQTSGNVYPLEMGDAPVSKWNMTIEGDNPGESYWSGVPATPLWRLLMGFGPIRALANVNSQRHL
jgi:hypothetical protein